MNIILASASPRRKELMQLITPDFITASADVDETLPPHIPNTQASAYLAELKASAAAENFPGDIVIGCDTTVLCGDKILGKPHSKEECRGFMELLSGRTHQVATACCIICGDRKETFTSFSDVTFRMLTAEEIEDYISTDEPYDKAGGYGIQGKAALLIDSICGDYYTIVGLPVSQLNQVLKNFTKE